MAQRRRAQRPRRSAAATRDLGAIATGALVLLGDRLGLYRAMRAGEPMTADELAQRTGTHDRHVREWLAAQAAAGYVDYDDAAGTFCLNPEQAAVFADEGSPASMAGAFEALSSLWLDEPKVAEAFRHGRGLGWHEHSQCLFRGTERFFRPGYNATWCRRGCPRSTAWWLGCSAARAWPTWVAATAHRPS